MQLPTDAAPGVSGYRFTSLAENDGSHVQSLHPKAGLIRTRPGKGRLHPRYILSVLSILYLQPTSDEPRNYLTRYELLSSSPVLDSMTCLALYKTLNKDGLSSRGNFAA
jgi:hypothetical protein